jgi:hypothetical protein
LNPEDFHTRVDANAQLCHLSFVITQVYRIAAVTSSTLPYFCSWFAAPNHTRKRSQNPLEQNRIISSTKYHNPLKIASTAFELSMNVGKTGNAPGGLGNALLSSLNPFFLRTRKLESSTAN